MKTRRLCPGCGRPLCKSSDKTFGFRCYNCDKDFTKAEVLRKADMAQVKKLRDRSILDDLWRGEYPHSHKRPYPRRKRHYQRGKPKDNRYTAGSLASLNGSYHYEHEVMQSDVDMANSYVNRIESTRSKLQPRNGDIIRLFNGRLYPGYQPERYVQWCYFEQKRVLPEKEWHALELPETAFRTKNNHRDNHPVKIGVNDALHLVTLYSICK